MTSSFHSRLPGFDWIESDADEGEGYVYGFSYGSSGQGVQELVGIHGTSIPCAVCEAKTSGILAIYGDFVRCKCKVSSLLVSLGTYKCPDRFSLEYAGYLMSNRNSHKKGEYVCVDQKAKTDTGTGSSSGSLWVPTEYKCGSLPCPPYTQDREVGTSTRFNFFIYFFFAFR